MEAPTRAGRPISLGIAAALAGLLALGCASPRPAPPRTEAELARWRKECGLLWIITADPGIRLHISITGKLGQAVDYGNGNVFGNLHLASSFCRTERPSVEDFECAFRTEAGAAATGTVEAWFSGALLGRWAFSKTDRFTARVHAGHE